MLYIWSFSESVGCFCGGGVSGGGVSGGGSGGGGCGYGCEWLWLCS